MKSLMAFVQCVLIDLGTRCGTSTSRDFKTVSVRFEHEGLSFLTITLSNFGKDFEKSLDQGYVAHDQFFGFARTGGLPRFLGGFLELVFDRKSGRLLDVPSIEAIRSIRQITLMFSKIDVPCSEHRIEAALDKYIECEKEVKRADAVYNLDDSIQYAYRRTARLLWASLLSSVDNVLYRRAVTPKHGPGATADRLTGNGKYDQTEWPRRLDRVFPMWEHLIPNERFCATLDRVELLEPGAERPVRVITVPKTLKTPRIIAIEPTAMQYMQQAILALLNEKMREDDNARNFVLSDSQEPNRHLAYIGSLTGELATLDLSEASDRVSNQHVRDLLRPQRHLFDAVDATRSRKADVPGRGVIRLAKFASMGSALCFPMEALVFATVVFVGIEKALNRPLTKRDIQSFYGRVRVYGDDIIVPVEYVQDVVETLEAFGFRVNRNKSFWTGKFRESCGKDYYSGNDVSVVKMRSLFPQHRRDAREIVSTAEFRNHLFEAGFELAVEFLDRVMMKIIPWPIVEKNSSLLGRYSYSPSQAERYDRNLYTPLVKGVMVTSELPESPLDDSGALMKWFLKKGDKPFQDKDHLMYSGRPRSVRIKTRWANPCSWGLGSQ